MLGGSLSAIMVGMTSTPPDVHEPTEGDVLKIWFEFMPREGWLPYDTEGLWATALGTDTARLDSAPFLQDGVAKDDVVRFETDEEGVHWCRERVRASGNCTIRVLPEPDGPLGRGANGVNERFHAFGLEGEPFDEALPLVAFNVPADADFAGIKELLRKGEAEGWWYFEVGCATDRWRAA